MRNALIDMVLLLEKEFDVLLLQRKGQRKVRNRKRNLLGIIVETKQIQLGSNRLDTALEFAYTLLFTRIRFDDMLDNFLANRNLLVKTDILERKG